MANYLDMVNRIADESMRPDLIQQIKYCVQDAISFYETQRFSFNQFNDRMVLTIAGQEFYSAIDSSSIEDALAIDSIVIETGSRRRKLKSVSYETLEEWSSDSSAKGEPTHFSFWGQQLRLYPIPNKEYRLRFSGIFKLPSLVDDSDQSAWTKEAELMIRARASAALYSRYLRDDSGAARSRMLEEEARENLLESTSRRQATGNLRAAL